MAMPPFVDIREVIAMLHVSIFIGYFYNPILKTAQVAYAQVYVARMGGAASVPLIFT